MIAFKESMYEKTIKENIELKKQVEQLENEVKEIEKVLDDRFIYVTGARTVYARLMQLSKEIIVKDDLKLRNEISQTIKENDKLKAKVKEQEESRQAVIEVLKAPITENNISCECNKLTLFFNKTKIEEIKKEIAKLIDQYRVVIYEYLKERR